MSDVIFVAVIMVFFVSAALLVQACGNIVAGSTSTVSRSTTDEDEPGRQRERGTRCRRRGTRGARVHARTRATLDTTGPTFAVFLLGVIVIVGGLIYLPMLILADRRTPRGMMLWPAVKRRRRERGLCPGRCRRQFGAIDPAAETGAPIDVGYVRNAVARLTVSPVGARAGFFAYADRARQPDRRRSLRRWSSSTCSRGRIFTVPPVDTAASKATSEQLVLS